MAKEKEKSVKEAVSYSFRLIDMDSDEYTTSVGLLHLIAAKLDDLNNTLEDHK